MTCTTVKILGLAKAKGRVGCLAGILTREPQSEHEHKVLVFQIGPQTTGAKLGIPALRDHDLVFVFAYFALSLRV